MGPGSMVNVADTLAGHIAAASFERIPISAIAAAKRAVVDTLGVAWAGTEEPTCPEVYASFVAQGGRPEATVWAHGNQMPAESCAYLNSLFASALDYDSIHAQAVIHSDIVVLPAAWAIAEREGASGKQFLTAFIVGSDLACRLGLAARRAAGWFYTSVFGIFGAAAAASKLLGHDRVQVRNALGLAFLQSAGSYQCVVERCLAKRHLSAFAARSGVAAALLSDLGVDGPSDMFAGRCGLYALYDQVDEAKLIADLGERYESASISFKYYPCCYCCHAAIDGILALHRRHGYINPGNVRGVTVVLSEYMADLVGAPFSPGDNNPQVAAQFSVRYAVAVAILRQRFTLADLETAAIFDAEALKLAAKVDVRIDPLNQGTVTPVDLVVNTCDGQTLKERVETVPGMPEQPLTNGELALKFENAVKRGTAPLSPNRCRELIGRIETLEEITDMRTFFGGILPSPADHRFKPVGARSTAAPGESL